MLGMFLGFLITVSAWIGVNKRKQRMERKKAKEREKDVEKAKSLEDSLSKLGFSATGSHSTTWPAFRGPPASAPQQPSTHQLVPIPWGQQ